MIPKWAFFIGFAGVIFALMGLEFLLDRPNIYPLSNSTKITSEKSPETVIDSFLLKKIQDFFLEKERQNTEEIFNKIQIPKDFNIAVKKYIFTNKENGDPFFVLYQFSANQKSESITIEYNKIKNLIKTLYEGDVEAEVNETNTYGEHSFYGNLGKNQKTVYLVTAFRDELLGFEYPKSHHENMKELYKELFHTR